MYVWFVCFPFVVLVVVVVAFSFSPWGNRLIHHLEVMENERNRIKLKNAIAKARESNYVDVPLKGTFKIVNLLDGKVIYFQDKLVRFHESYQHINYVRARLECYHIVLHLNGNAIFFHEEEWEVVQY